MFLLIQLFQQMINSDYFLSNIFSANRSLIFKDDAEKKVSISVRIFEFDVPFAGFAMVTTTGAIYEITDRDSGEIAFSERLSTSGRVEANEAFSGLTRAMESANKAVRNNIQKFIDAAEQANL